MFWLILTAIFICMLVLESEDTITLIDSYLGENPQTFSRGNIDCSPESSRISWGYLREISVIVAIPLETVNDLRASRLKVQQVGLIYKRIRNH